MNYTISINDVLSNNHKEEIISTLDNFYREKKDGQPTSLTITDDNKEFQEVICAVVNYYVDDCLKGPSEKCFVNIYVENYISFSECVYQFMQNIYVYQDKTYNELFNECHKMDVFYRDYSYSFKVFLTKDIVNDAKYMEFMGLGPDWLMGTFHPNVIFKYILPRFYLSLYKDKLLGNEKYCNLTNYMIGLS